MDGQAAALVRRLGIVVTDDPRPAPVRSAAAAAHARVAVRGQVFDGFGAAPTPSLARLVAVMECAERWAQFGRTGMLAVRDSCAALGEAALCPLDFGLYTPAQYRQPGFGLAPFDVRAPLEWIPVTELVTGNHRLIPVEFVYPNASIGRPALVAETSSGTAIHTDPIGATTAALCEVIERDAAMVLWYRRPPSRVVPIDALPDDVASELRRLTRAGFVVCVARIDHDITVPTFLAIALRDRSFAHGLGTHPDAIVALRHAVVELGRGIRTNGGRDRYVHLPVGQVRRPEHHRALYDDGPLHDALRRFLDNTLVREATPVGSDRPAPADVLGALLAALDAHRLTAYACDLTPPELADCGVTAVRVLVPGLVPLSFGADRLRLGSHRLVGTAAPGRLTTLLPHFIG